MSDVDSGLDSSGENLDPRAAPSFKWEQLPQRPKRSTPGSKSIKIKKYVEICRPESDDKEKSGSLPIRVKSETESMGLKNNKRVEHGPGNIAVTISEQVGPDSISITNQCLWSRINSEILEFRDPDSHENKQEMPDEPIDSPPVIAGDTEIIFGARHTSHCNLCKEIQIKDSYFIQEKIIKTHQQVFHSQVPNFIGCRIPVYSKLNISFLRELLRGYSDVNVIDFLEFGGLSVIMVLSITRKKQTITPGPLNFLQI